MSEENKAKQKKDPMIWGLILMALGVIFLLDSLRIADAGELISTYWPVAIMAIGVRMVLQARPKKPKPVETKAVAANQHLTLSKTFGSVGIKIDSKSFSGGKVSTLVGDVLVDLSEANIRSGEKTLKLNGVIGDISVSLPKNVKVSVQANTLLGDLSVMDYRKGGFAVRRKYESDGFDKAKKKLVISASQVCGDVTVSHAFE